MGKTVYVLLITLLLFFDGVCSFSAPSSPARIVNGLLSNAFSRLMKWSPSLKIATRTAIKGRPMMKFEGGYNVETVFDGSKLGIDPYSVEVLPDGDLIVLDSANSNLYRISSSLSLYSRPRLVTGSGDGYAGHVDGKLRDARMNHPKGLTVDDRGNIYVADTDNMAIRKISDTGVTTIAGGKRTRGGGHVDGPSEDAKFSDDFDVVYMGSSCSLLVIDRGNKAIREIQLNFDDCAYQYGSSYPVGIAVLLMAAFFGYMLALIQRRVGSSVSPHDYQEVMNESIGFSQEVYQKPSKPRPSLIPTTQEEPEKQDESFTGSLGRFVAKTKESSSEILGGLFPMFKRKKLSRGHRNPLPYPWPAQDSYVVPNEDEPPVETQTPKKTYAFMSRDSEKMQQLRQSRVFYLGLDGDVPKKTKKQQQNRHQYQWSGPQTYLEQSGEKTKEIIFGAVQEQEKQRKPVVIKPLDHGTLSYDHQNVRSRFSYMNGQR